MSKSNTDVRIILDAFDFDQRVRSVVIIYASTLFYTSWIAGSHRLVSQLHIASYAMVAQNEPLHKYLRFAML